MPWDIYINILFSFRFILFDQVLQLTQVSSTIFYQIKMNIRQGLLFPLALLMTVTVHAADPDPTQLPQCAVRLTPFVEAR